MNTTVPNASSCCPTDAIAVSCRKSARKFFVASYRACNRCTVSASGGHFSESCPPPPCGRGAAPASDVAAPVARDAPDAGRAFAPLLEVAAAAGERPAARGASVGSCAKPSAAERKNEMDAAAASAREVVRCTRGAHHTLRRTSGAAHDPTCARRRGHLNLPSDVRGLPVAAPLPPRRPRRRAPCARSSGRRDCTRLGGAAVARRSTPAGSR